MTQLEITRACPHLKLKEIAKNEGGFREFLFYLIDGYLSNKYKPTEKSSFIEFF